MRDTARVRIKANNNISVPKYPTVSTFVEDETIIERIGGDVGT